MSKSQAVLVAVTSDQHTGSTVGLAPPEGTRRDDGGRMMPSKAQIWLWNNWLKFWQTVKSEQQANKARLICVFNGDATDGGAHHGTTQVMTEEDDATAYITRRVFSVPKDLNPAKLYMVKGTDVHVGGPAAPQEVSIAQRLGCERDPESQTWASWHLRLTVNGLLLDFQHHGRAGNRPWTRQNAVSALAADIWMEHSLAGLRAPDLAFRSHVHRFADSYDAYPTRVVVTPAWQLKTSFVHRIGPESIADIGGVMVLIKPDGFYTVNPLLYRPSQPRARSV